MAWLRDLQITRSTESLRYRLCWCSGVGVCSGLSYFNTDVGSSADFCSWCGKVFKDGKFMNNSIKMLHGTFLLMKSRYKSCPPTVWRLRFVMVGILDCRVYLTDSLGPWCNRSDFDRLAPWQLLGLSRAWQCVDLKRLFLQWFQPNWAMKKIPGGWGYIGDYTIQLYGDYNKSL